MLDNKSNLIKLIHTITELFRAEYNYSIVDLLTSSEITAEQTYYDNWNGGTIYFTIYITAPVDKFIIVQDEHSEIEKKIQEKADLILRVNENIQLGQVVIVPISVPYINWGSIVELFTKEQLLSEIYYLKNTMISAATGEVNIQTVNNEYQERYLKVAKALSILKVDNPNTFSDLWQWYTKCKSGDLPQYHHRRTFIGEMYTKLIRLLEDAEYSDAMNVTVNLRGWERIERSIKEIKSRLAQARNEEQFQTVGLLCRETIVSLAQAIYSDEKYPTVDGVKPSETDAKRMLEAYINIELKGGRNEVLRKYVRASNDLANDLTHRRTANAKDAALCSAATISLVNFVGIMENRF